MKVVKRFFSFIYRIKVLLSALIIFSFLDGIITYYLVEGDFGREGNPFLKDLAEDWEFIIVKLLGGILCAFILWDIYRRWPKLALISSSCLVTLLGFIVMWNICVYFISAG